MLQNGRHLNLAATTTCGCAKMFCAKFVALTKAFTKMTVTKRKWPLP